MSLSVKDEPQDEPQVSTQSDASAPADSAPASHDPSVEDLIGACGGSDKTEPSMVEYLGPAVKGKVGS